MSGANVTDGNEIPWQWPEEVWRPIVEAVRAGRSLVPPQWPGGAEVAVGISFDADHETPLLRENMTSPGGMAAGEYGARVAVPRLLRLLADREVPASFFTPAVSGLLYPHQIEQYLAEGHEVGVHGWIHERNTLLDYDDEIELTMKSLDTLEQIGGRRPTGIRTPSWDFSPHTLEIIEKCGFLYDSSMMADDSPYELVRAGTPTGVVELPVEWIRDDAVYFGMARYAGLRPYTSPETVFEIWRDEFEGARREGSVFQVTMHPSIIGHHSRIQILARLIDHIQQSGSVWFATHEQIAQYVAQQAGMIPEEAAA